VTEAGKLPLLAKDKRLAEANLVFACLCILISPQSTPAAPGAHSNAWQTASIKSAQRKHTAFFQFDDRSLPSGATPVQRTRRTPAWHGQSKRAP